MLLRTSKLPAFAATLIALIAAGALSAAEPVGSPYYEPATSPFDPSSTGTPVVASAFQQAQYQAPAAPYSPYGTPPAGYPSDLYPMYQQQPMPEPWTWQALPDGIIYESYVAGHKEPRIGGAFLHSDDRGWVWDIQMGGRVGLLRYGTTDDFHPQGWQIDLEAAAFPLLNMEEQEDLDAVDFRGGLPITFSNGPVEYKFGYYHISAHVGDEFLERNPGFTRDNYVRDAIMFGTRVHLTPDFRIYGEAAYAFNADGGAEPWELQGGIEYAPAHATGFRPVPFAAANAHLYQEFDFGGSVNVMAGLQWRGAKSGHTLRTGVQYFNGRAFQYAFFDEHDEFVGLGLWYDY